MRMLNYTGIDTHNSAIVEQASNAIVKLDLNEKSFMLLLLADLEHAHVHRSLANHSFYKGWLPHTI